MFLDKFYITRHLFGYIKTKYDMVSLYSIRICMLMYQCCIYMVLPKSGVVRNRIRGRYTKMHHSPYSRFCQNEAATALFANKYCITRYFRGRKFSRKMNLRYFHGKIFSRIYCSRENIFPRKCLLAKISSRENTFPRMASVPHICRLVGLGYAVYYGRVEEYAHLKR